MRLAEAGGGRTLSGALSSVKSEVCYNSESGVNSLIRNLRSTTAAALFPDAGGDAAVLLPRRRGEVLVRVRSPVPVLRGGARGRAGVRQRLQISGGSGAARAEGARSSGGFRRGFVRGYVFRHFWNVRPGLCVQEEWHSRGVGIVLIRRFGFGVGSRWGMVLLSLSGESCLVLIARRGDGRQRHHLKAKR